MIRLTHDGIAGDADYRAVSERLIARRQLDDKEWTRLSELMMAEILQRDEPEGR